MAMRIWNLIVVFVVAMGIPSYSKANETYDAYLDLNDFVHGDYGFDESEVGKRVGQLDISVSPKFTDVVKGYINGYVVRNRQKSGVILGRSSLYFPLFEYYLSVYNLPADLKYLPIVESALNPNAVSRSGAVGLWQFMKPTAKRL